MKSDKSIKYKLYASIVSLVLCVCMLFGTTFAWFTVEIESGENVILAGSLDVELTHQTAGMAAPAEVDSSTKLFKVDYWEPGVVCYENLTIRNVGDLAFKYDFTMNPLDFNYIIDKSDENNKEFNLMNVLKVAVVENGFNGDTREAAKTLSTNANTKLFKDFTFDGGVLYSKKEAEKDDSLASERTIGIIVFWPDDNEDSVDELYNVWGDKETSTKTEGEKDRLFIKFGLRFKATQYTYEKDSFDEKYDENAVRVDTVSAPIEAGKDTVITSVATLSNEDGKTTKVTFPSTVVDFTPAQTSTMTVKATPTLAANHKFKVNSDNGSVGAIDLTVKVNDVVVDQFKNSEGVAVPVIVETYIAKNLTNVSLAYTKANGENETWTQVTNESDVNAVGKLYYDKDSGRLCYMTTHFSTFVLGANETFYVEETNTAYNADKFDTIAQLYGGTVYLLKDYTYNDTKSYVAAVMKNMILDLNGYSMNLNGASNGFYLYKNVKLTLRDSNPAQNNKITNSGKLVYQATGELTNENVNMICTGGNAVYSVSGIINVNGGEITCNTGYGICLYPSKSPDHCTLNITGGTINANTSIVTSGNNAVDNATISISNGNINGSIYKPDGGNITITGGTFTGTTCLYVKGGHVNISGGTFTAIKGDGDWAHGQSGWTNTGDAVIVEGCNYPAGNPYVAITGGTFKGYKEEGGTESASGNIFFKNYGILVINYGGNTANMSGTTVPYRNAVVASNTAEGFVTTNGYIHFTDDNTTLVTPNAE